MQAGFGVKRAAEGREIHAREEDLRNKLMKSKDEGQNRDQEIEGRRMDRPINRDKA